MIQVTGQDAHYVTHVEATAPPRACCYASYMSRWRMRFFPDQEIIVEVEVVRNPVALSCIALYCINVVCSVSSGHGFRFAPVAGELTSDPVTNPNARANPGFAIASVRRPASFATSPRTLSSMIVSNAYQRT